MSVEACCFTGHRVLPGGDRYFEVRRLTEQAIRDAYANGCRRFFAGGALGFDTYAARAVLILKREYPDVTLSLFLPCLDQADAWSEADKAEYERIKEEADEVLSLADRYFDGCMQKRNRYMVDNSSHLICYQMRQSGGTAYTVSYAKKQGLQITNLAQHTQLSLPI